MASSPSQAKWAGILRHCVENVGGNKMKWKIIRMFSVAEHIRPDFHEPHKQAAAPTIRHPGMP
jgi:hypothetical protein